MGRNCLQNDVISTAKEEGVMEGEKIGREKGRKEGMREGEMRERMKNASNLKNLGVAPEIIAQATGLALEEIEKL